MPLTPDRLEAIRQRWEANMPESWITLPQTQTRSLEGAEDEITYPDPSTPGLDAFPCRIKPATAAGSAAQVTEGPVAGGTGPRIYWTVQLPVRSRVNPADRGYVTGFDASGQAWSKTLEVVGPAGPRTWEAVRELLCWEELPVTVTVEVP